MGFIPHRFVSRIETEPMTQYAPLMFRLVGGFWSSVLGLYLGSYVSALIMIHRTSAEGTLLDNWGPAVVVFAPIVLPFCLILPWGHDPLWQSVVSMIGAISWLCLFAVVWWSRRPRFYWEFMPGVSIFLWSLCFMPTARKVLLG